MLSFSLSDGTGKDVLVLWNSDGTKNVVSATSLQFGGELRRGTLVSMPWVDGNWTGRVLAVDGESSCSSDSETDDIPLARFMTRKVGE